MVRIVDPCCHVRSLRRLLLNGLLQGTLPNLLGLVTIYPGGVLLKGKVGMVFAQLKDLKIKRQTCRF